MKNVEPLAAYKALKVALWQLDGQWRAQLEQIPESKREYHRLQRCAGELMEIIQRYEGLHVE